MNDKHSPNEQQYRRETYPRSRKGILKGLLAFALMIPLAVFASSMLPEQTKEERAIMRLLGLDTDERIAVGGLMELEDIWALEDTRTQSETPLITRMYHGENSLGYDEAQRTFYCTLGLGTGSDWPEIALSIPHEEGTQAVQVAFVDDYTYDWCDDAIREGYRYEMFAYTDTQFEYVGIVFTGLPIVTLNVDGGGKIPKTGDVSADVSFNGTGVGSVHSRALVHERGGGWAHGIDKFGYRVELHTLSAKGQDKKNDQSVLGMAADSDWLLIPSPDDETCLRNQLSFDLWRDWNGGEGYTMLEGQLVELFLNDEYTGIYQVLQRIKPDEEIVRMGGNLDTDVVVRRINQYNPTDKPTWDLEPVIDSILELRYAPAWMTPEQAFEVFEDYVAIEGINCEPLSDEEFIEKASGLFDMESLMSYFLFIQSLSGSKDNVVNNVYIWATRQEDGSYKYSFSPWDMDNMFVWLSESSVGSHEIQDVDRINWLMTAFNRILQLDVDNAREHMWRIWREKRDTLMADDTIYQRIADMEEMLNASGAYLRETERWRGGATTLDARSILSLAVMHQSTLEWYMKNTWALE